MNSTNQQTLRVAIIIVIIAALLGIVSLLSGFNSVMNVKLLVICFLVLVFGITAVISMVVASKPLYKNLGLAGIIFSSGAFIIFFLITIAELESESLLRIASAFAIAAIGTAHICLLHHFNLQNKYAYYARITGTIAISIFSLLLIVKIFDPFPSIYTLYYDQSMLKIMCSSLIVDLAATLLVPLTNRLEIMEKVTELHLPEEQPSQPGENDQPTA